jgi:DNA (cytosine-5)-methyltransferase 1
MTNITYGSVCSGIEAATQAWHPLGWRPAFFSEIEPFPSAALAHHYPSVPNHGDMTKFEEWPEHAIDLLVGGTPCQSFSVAGLRKGLDDPRGNLMLTYLAIARRYQPRWLVWENVPGVLSSNGGRDFGTFIRGLEECGYHAAWRVLDAQYCRVDGFAEAVPQRRRRVFVVGYLGDWRSAAAVLFEREGMRWDSAPSRKAGKGIAPTIASRPTGGGGLGTDFDLDGGLIASTGSVPHCLNAGGMGRIDYETETMVAHPMTLAIRGRDGQPDIEWRQDGTANAILTPNGGRAGIGVGAIAFGAQNSSSQGDGVSYEIVSTLDKSKTPAVAHAIQAGALRENPNSGPDGAGVQEGIAYTLEARAEVQAVQAAWAVRRLTPTECERLQGFPDGYTQVPNRGKPAADGPRYKALGNSMAVNCMRWIGQRIDTMEAILEAERTAA